VARLSYTIFVGFIAVADIPNEVSSFLWKLPFTPGKSGGFLFLGLGSFPLNLLAG
jgi:hypothetical protein